MRHHFSATARRAGGTLSVFCEPLVTAIGAHKRSGKQFEIASFNTDSFSLDKSSGHFLSACSQHALKRAL
jgi:hypothetical protein